MQDEKQCILMADGAADNTLLTLLTKPLMSLKFWFCKHQISFHFYENHCKNRDKNLSIIYIIETLYPVFLNFSADYEYGNNDTLWNTYSERYTLQ